MAKKWYIIHTYSGFERKVAESLMNLVQAKSLEDKIGQILIPTEDVVETKSGKKIVTTKLTFPGYILVEMDMTDKAWHIVRGTPKVTGFISTGKKPTPLTEEEIMSCLARFTGRQLQAPPSFSAVKHQGERLYKLARQGIEVARQTRTVTIHAMELLDLAPSELEMDVHCSKGTYVRTLAEDIGASKPHPDMFQAALKQAGVAAEDIIHVGDDAEHDILGARNMGMRTIWVNTRHAVWPGGERADREITNLQQLSAAIDSINDSR